MRLIDADTINMDGLRAPGYECSEPCDYYLGATCAFELINAAPTVEAVPLKDLCLLLHDVTNTPCHTFYGAEKCQKLVNCNPEWDDAECWEAFLRAWLKERYNEAN